MYKEQHREEEQNLKSLGSIGVPVGTVDDDNVCPVPGSTNA